LTHFSDQLSFLNAHDLSLSVGRQAVAVLWNCASTQLPQAMAAQLEEDEHAAIRVDPPPIGERVRGRNRSESFAGDDDLMISEIDAAVGNDSAAGRSNVGSGSSTPASPAASAGPPKHTGGQLSRRTLKILSSLEPEGPPGASRRSAPVDEALLAEALLAEEEAASASAGVIRRASMAPSTKAGPEHDMVIKILLLGDGGECCSCCPLDVRRLPATYRAIQPWHTRMHFTGVGKTSLLLRYADNTFSANMMPTAGCVAIAVAAAGTSSTGHHPCSHHRCSTISVYRVAFKTEMLEIQGKRIKFQIWDTAGQSRFHVITQAYYKGAHGIVLVYDASQADQSSFQSG
jgi:hypothetical protein